MVKKLFLAITIATFSMSLFAQAVEEVTLTVSGDGATKTEATQLALRSAIEQAFGVFVSANTQILNDELVKDEIATVSSGNIKKYEEIASAILPNGNTTVTLKAVVSISKLITYAQSKGSSAEFAGATFGMNMKLKELNKANEEKAIENMINQLTALIPSMFDYKLELGEPRIEKLFLNDVYYEQYRQRHEERYYEEVYAIPAKVIVIFNDNTEIANNILLNTLASLSLTENEVEEYKKTGLKPAYILVGNCPDGIGKLIKPLSDPDSYYCREGENPKIYCLRSKMYNQIILLQKIFSEAIYNFTIDANTGISSFFDRLKEENRIKGQCVYYTFKGMPASFESGIIGRGLIKNEMRIIKDNIGMGIETNVLINNEMFEYNSVRRIRTSIIEDYRIAYNRGYIEIYGVNISSSAGDAERYISLTLPHIIKKSLPLYKDDLVPYIIDDIILTIPKDDIMKYNNFIITHKDYYEDFIEDYDED